MPDKKPTTTLIETLELGDPPEGSSWDDELNVTMTRAEWAVVFAVVESQFAKTTEAYDRAYADALDGDVAAQILVPLIGTTCTVLQDIVKKIVRVTQPDLASALDTLVATLEKAGSNDSA